MNAKEFIKFKKENPELLPDFLVSIGGTGSIRYTSIYDKANQLMTELCNHQEQKFYEGTKVPEVIRKNLKIFIS